MADRKFAALAGLRALDAEGATPVASSPLIGQTRRLGKRSDPAWRGYTVLLPHVEHDQALDILRRTYPGADFSDLLTTLLRQWLAQEGASHGA